MAKAKPKPKAKPGAKPSGKPSAKRKAKPSATAALPKVRVRMYRQGLGDCFLLTFHVGDKAKERHMLIDCGTLGSKANVKIKDVAADVKKIIEAGSGKVDIVVATHEHADHLSGFNSDMKFLENKVGHVWLAWTENPEDSDAQKFAKHKGDLGAALAMVVQSAPTTAVGQQVNDLLGFVGDATLGAAKFATTINQAMEFVRTGLKAKTIYHTPGTFAADPEIEGFRFYVLGPPRKETFMKDVGEHGSGELYGISARLRMAAQTPGGQSLQDGNALPFDGQLTQSGDVLRQQQYPRYHDANHKWRTIDDDWLNGASDLALQLDNLTNNSSLALAIERIADGKVLLFPADAQEGNWLSWHESDLTWSVDNGSGAKNVTAADLLARTVFYKTGHHGSHNATARGKGLELMSQQAELTAFIPVDRAIALGRNPKDSWQMPARPLYLRLLEKCQGRVVRADLGWAAAAAAGDETEKEFLGMAPPAKWSEWISAQKAAEHVDTSNAHFIDYVLE